MSDRTVSGEVYRTRIDPASASSREAMKMEHYVPAITSGRVREIRVEVGSQVEAGQMLVILDTLETES